MWRQSAYGGAYNNEAFFPKHHRNAHARKISIRFEWWILAKILKRMNIINSINDLCLSQSSVNSIWWNMQNCTTEYLFTLNENKSSYGRMCTNALDAHINVKWCKAFGMNIESSAAT